MEKKTVSKTSRSKKMALMIPTILLCLLAWVMFYVWYEGNFWFWGLLIAFVAVAGWIARVGIRKKRSGSPTWGSWVFVMYFLLFLLPVAHMIITLLWAFLEVLPQ